MTARAKAGAVIERCLAELDRVLDLDPNMPLATRSDIVNARSRIERIAGDLGHLDAAQQRELRRQLRDDLR